MVTATAQPAFYSPLLGETTGPLVLRVQGTEHDGRVLHIRSPKCLIGSDPTCTLRLRSATVRPFHCLILRGTEGMFIRRWSPDTCLNGCGFDEARLRPGDRILVGAIELEVLPSTPLAVSEPPIAPPTERDQNEGIEELRNAIASYKAVCHDQLIEHRTLASQAEASAGRIESLQDEVDRLRNELNAERCLASNSGTHLEAELDFRSQQRFDTQEQLTELQCSWDGRFAQWQVHKKQLHEDLEAAQAQGEAFRLEIETLRFQVAEAAARAAELDVRPPASQPVPGDIAADVVTWKEVAEGLRRELQQTREEHRRVREEWHVDRHSLECELNVHSTAVLQLEQKYKQDMREAEMLIHAMQQEGKHLLVQLEEAKQSIRQGADGHKRKRPSLVNTVRSLVVDAAGPLTPKMSGKPPVGLAKTPKSPPPSACPTMLMDASPVAAGGLEPDDDEGAIQQYMERLLHRVARVPEGGISEDRDTSPPMAVPRVVTSMSRPEIAPTAEPAAKTTDPVRETVLVRPSPHAAQEPCPASEPETMPAVPPAPREPMKLRGAVPPEIAADLRTLRELANRTARRDVDRTDDRRSKVAAAGDIAVASVCLVSGSLASVLSSSFFSVETLGGAIGISFGMISLLRGVRTCIHLQKKRSEAMQGGTGNEKNSVRR